MGELVSIDRAADARARIYASELRALINESDRRRTTCLSSFPSQMPNPASELEYLLEELRALADRMDGGNQGPEPASLDAWRNR